VIERSALPPIDPIEIDPGDTDIVAPATLSIIPVIFVFIY
jgi:hypothetical protein